MKLRARQLLQQQQAEQLLKKQKRADMNGTSQQSVKHVDKYAT